MRSNVKPFSVKFVQVLFLTTCISMFSCQEQIREEKLITKSANINLGPAKEYLDESNFQKIDTTDTYFQIFKKSSKYESIKFVLGNFEIKNILLRKFTELNSVGLVISLNDIGLVKRDIMLAINLDNNEFLIPFIRLHNTGSSNSTNFTARSGKIKWYSQDGFQLNEIAVEKNRIAKFTILKNENAKLTWTCTEEQFNYLYQSAKNECESDWQCDLACSFNPCAVAYVAYAVSKCVNETSGIGNTTRSSNTAIKILDTF